MVQKCFYNIEEMATILGKTPAAIHGHLARKQFDAVPQPMKFGRRLAWMIEEVEAWIDGKRIEAAELREDRYEPPVRLRKIGRPTKA